ncbi:MAG: HigA family addiction module antidote protein [Ignavibacteriaceae bacterium]|nr:HigA family addiction module antidote protein [Ignavibacteriaceae bacterium]
MAQYKNEYFPDTLTHPGVDLAEKLEEIGMGSKEFAIRTDKPEKTISAIINGKSSITPEMAVRFETVLKIPANYWLNSQKKYDEIIARAQRQRELSSCVSWLKKFPIKDLIELGWIPKFTNPYEGVEALFDFFAVSNETAWKDYYLESKLKTDFRISLTREKNPFALSAWLRKGELEAKARKTEKYSESKLKKSLPILKSVMVSEEADFDVQIQNICGSAGLRVIYLPSIKGSCVNGATRWIDGSPLIQLSDRFKRYDIFWFTLFHEIGHILLHGKKDIFIESDEKIQSEPSLAYKEEEADDFACDQLFSKKDETEFIRIGKYDQNSIIKFAKTKETHPSIIVGRLHHRNVLKKNIHTKLLKKIDFSVK